MKNRRTIRKYSQQDVDNQLLHQLLEEAERTQTMGNLQLYSVVVTRSEEMKDKLAPFHFNQPMVKEAPVVLTFCADFRRTTIWAENRQADPAMTTSSRSSMPLPTPYYIVRHSATWQRKRDWDFAI